MNFLRGAWSVWDRQRSVCNKYWLLLVSLDSVVWQFVWRPRRIRIGVVWLVASCRQMLISVCLFGLGLWAQLGRQAAWRPWCIEMVSSGWWHCLAVAVVIACCGLWFGLVLGRQAAWRPRCIRIGVAWLVASCLQLL